jgi:hypothetical protein
MLSWRNRVCRKIHINEATCRAHDVEASPAANPNEMYSFTNGIKLDPSWAPPFWIKLGLWDLVELFSAMVINRYRYPPEFGCLYIPKVAIDAWNRDAEKELGKDRWVSTHDLLAAWMSKVGAGIVTLALYHSNPCSTPGRTTQTIV